MSVRRDPRTGHWYFRTRVTYPDGKRDRISGTPGVPGPYHDLPQTKLGAQKAEQLAITKAITGQTVRIETAQEVPTIRSYVDPFMKGYSADDKPSSLTDKQQRLDAYILPVVGDVRLDLFRQEHVDRIVAMQLGRKLGRKTINNITSVLSSLIGYAVTNKIIADPELSFMINAQDTEMDPVAPEGVDAIAAVACKRYRVGILLGADAGLRIGEIRALQRAEVNQIAREIRVTSSYDREGHLTETKGWDLRTVPMTERLWNAMRDHDGPGPLVFARLDGKPIGYDAVRDHIHEIYEAAKVDAPTKPWHALRHTFGTELANKGTPVHVIRELMGHKSIETTMRYMHTTRDQKRAAILAPSGSHRAAEQKSTTK